MVKNGEGLVLRIHHMNGVRWTWRGRGGQLSIMHLCGCDVIVLPTVASIYTAFVSFTIPPEHGPSLERSIHV